MKVYQKVKITVIYLSVIYILLNLGIYFFHDNFIFMTQKSSKLDVDNILENNPRSISISVTANDGTLLHGFLINQNNNKPKKVVLVFLGNAQKINSNLIKYFSSFENWSFVLVDYRGYGQSEGHPSENVLYSDALSVYKWIKEKLNPSQFAVFGHSLGSAVATQLASKASFEKIVLISPFESCIKLAEEYLPTFYLPLLFKYKFESELYAKQIETPVHVFVGTKDNIVPNSHSRKLFECWKSGGTYIKIVGADHNNMLGQKQFFYELHKLFN
ncbi:MAG: alpha/beta fold hydrolase [Candidatus Cloacimonetes bacterium]|nr:alpha/beta fold hydrolase [Candidatus Cloacimonadota bacterium]